MATVLLESALRSLVLALAVGLVLWIVRARGPRVQMVAWTFVLAGAISMPFLMRWRPIEIRPPARVIATAPVVLHTASIAMPSPSAASEEVSAPIPWFLIAATVYAAGALILLARLFTGLFLTLNLWRRAMPLHEDWAGPTDIRETPVIGAPATFASSILLPSDWRTWDEPKLRAVLAHERSHVEWFDFYVLLIARLHLAVFWFSPLAWWLRGRLAGLAEAACDDAALGAIADRPSYAGILVAFAYGAQPAPEAVAMARLSTVGRRVDRILSSAALPANPGWKQYALLAACASGLAALTAGCSLNGQTSAKPAASPAKSSESAAAAKKPDANVFWWQSGSGHGDSYVIVSGDSMTMSGSSGDAERARSYRGQFTGAYIWFRHDGKEYLITDPAAVKRAQELFRPQEELGRKQAELGEQQAKLGEQQAELGERQARASVRVPDLDDNVRALRALVQASEKESREKMARDLANSDELLAKLQAELGEVKNRELTQEQIGELQAKAAEAQERLSGEFAGRLAELQSRIAELQSKFGEMQAHAGEIQAKLGQEQSRLGAEQAKLGEQQSKLGEQQSRLAREAERQLRRLFEESLQNGSAKAAK